MPVQHKIDKVMNKISTRIQYIDRINKRNMIWAAHIRLLGRILITPLIRLLL